MKNTKWLLLAVVTVAVGAIPALTGTSRGSARALPAVPRRQRRG